MTVVSLFAIWKTGDYPGQSRRGKTYFAMMLTAVCTNRKTFPNMEEIENRIKEGAGLLNPLSYY